MVEDLRQAKTRKTRLVGELQDLESVTSGSMAEIGPEEVVESISNLKNALKFATPIERKDLLSHLSNSSNLKGHFLEFLEILRVNKFIPETNQL